MGLRAPEGATRGPWRLRFLSPIQGSSEGDSVRSRSQPDHKESAMSRGVFMALGLRAWGLWPGTASADLTLSGDLDGPGTSAFRVQIDGVPDLASYRMDVLLELPGVSFLGASVSETYGEAWIDAETSG